MMASALRLQPSSLHESPTFALYIEEKHLVMALEVRRLTSEQDQMLVVWMSHNFMTFHFPWHPRVFTLLTQLFPDDAWKLHLLGGPRNTIEVQAPHLIEEQVLWGYVSSVNIVILSKLS